MKDQARPQTTQTKNAAKGLYLNLGALNPVSPQSITSLARAGNDASIAVAT